MADAFHEERERSSRGIASRIIFFVIWGSFILIGIGVLSMLIRYKEMVFIPNINVKKPDFLKSKFEIEFLTMALTCAGVLVLTVVLPYVATGYGIDRLYSLVMVILSICFVIGGMMLSKHFFFLKEKQKSFFKKKALSKEQKEGRTDELRNGKGNALQETSEKYDQNAAQVRAYLIILLILIPYFLMVTGVTHQIVGIQTSILLNSEVEEYEREYLHDHECSSAKWLKNCAEKKDRIYPTDFFGARKLASHAEIPETVTDFWSFSKHAKLSGYLYLTYNNVVNDKFEGATNSSDHADMFVGKNEIYDNGGSEVWRC